MTEAAQAFGGVELKGASRRVLLNTGWLSATKLASDAVGLVLFVVLSRRFGSSGIGQYAYGYAIAMLAYMAVHFGLEDWGVRECARLSPARVRVLLGGLVGTQVVVAGLVVAVLIGFLVASGTPGETATIIVFLSTGLVATALARTLFVPAVARQSMAGPAIADLGFRGLSVGIGLVLALGFGSSLSTALVGFPICGAGLLAVAFTSAVRRVGMFKPRLGFPSVRRVVGLAWPFAAAHIVFQIYARADVIMLSWLQGAAAAGIYASSIKFVEVGVMPIVLLGFAAYPGLSQLAAAGDNTFRKGAERLLRTSMFLGCLLAWGLFFVAPRVVAPLLGPEFRSAVPILKVMAVLAPLLAVELAIVRVLLATELQLRRIKLQVAGTALNVVMNLFLIPPFGVVGALVASITSLVVLDALYLAAVADRVLLRRALGTLRWFLVPISISIGVGLAAGRGFGVQWLTAAAALAAFVGTMAVTGLIPGPWARGVAGAVVARGGPR